MIYHIAERAAWQAAQAVGAYRPSSLETEGFIHCSERGQLAAVAAAFFHGRTDLVLLTIDPARAAAPLVYENTTGGVERFPHLYGALPTTAVIHVAPLTPSADGRFDL